MIIKINHKEEGKLRKIEKTKKKQEYFMFLSFPLLIKVAINRKLEYESA